MTALPVARPAVRPRPAGRSSPARAPQPGRGPRPQLRVVPPRFPRGRYLAAGASVLLAGVFGTLALNALAAGAAFEAWALEQELSALTLRRDELVASVAHLESPNRAFEYATAHLGLIRPEQPGFLDLDAPLPDGFQVPDKPMTHLPAS